MVKRWILRSDGVLQRYNIKNLKKYSATSQKFKGRKVFQRIIKKRRKQIVFNSKYAISFRVIQINGKATLKELELRADEFVESNFSNLAGFFFKELPKKFLTKGYEDEFIDVSEDEELDDDKIYAEVNIRGNITLEEI